MSLETRVLGMGGEFPGEVYSVVGCRVWGVCFGCYVAENFILPGVLGMCSCR